jgi:hypothetical protein
MNPTANQRVEAMTRSAVTLLFQSGATGALLVMPHPFRSVNARCNSVLSWGR